MLLRLAYLGITNAFALLRLLPGSGRDMDHRARRALGRIDGPLSSA
jgi:hypothetical protein